MHLKEKIIMALYCGLLTVNLHPVLGGGDDQPTTGPQPPQTVDGLVQEALAKNAELKYYEAAVGAAKGDRRQAGMWKNPELAAEGGYRRVTDLAGEELPSDGYTVGVSLSQTFEFPGKATLRKALADKDVEQAELALRQFRLALAGKVRLLAYEYLVATESASVAVDIRDRSQALIELLLKRPTAGPRELLEVRAIEGSIWELRTASKRFLLTQETTRLEINALLGRPSSMPLRLQDQIRPPNLLLNREKLIFAALQHNLQLSLRKVELEKAIKSIDASRLEQAPDFTVGPFFSQDRAGEEETNVGVAVSLPLPLWNRNEGGIQAAKAKKLQAEALMLQARREVEKAVVTAYRELELDSDLFATMSSPELDKLKSASDISDRQYRLGSISVQLFLESQRGYLGALESRGEVLIGLWRNALELQLLSGGKMEVTP